MPTKMVGAWSLSTLLQMTEQVAKSRFTYADRDVIKSAVQIKKITTYEGKNPLEGKVKFEITSSSYPQYYPYYTKFDSRGRSRSYQRKYKHQYKVIIQADALTMTSPVRIRTGSDKSYEFHPNPNLIKSKKNPYGKYLSIGDYNIMEKGVNPDFFFTNSYIRWVEKCLYGRNYANGFPKERNPLGVPFLNKHEIVVVETLLSAGVLTLR